MRAPAAILIALALLAHSAAASTCPPIDRSPTAPPVYVVLYGYPHMPDEPERTLKQVDEDLLHMADFFAALGPRRMWVHGEREPKLIEHFGPDLAPASWRALLTTVTELRTLLATEPDARVYLYFSGHGARTRRGSSPSAELFGHPEPGATERGYNGRIDGGILADHILTPLSERADVHLIVDTCMSFFLLSARAPREPIFIRRAAKAPPPYNLEAPFTEKLPRVGASLAAHYVTYEAPDQNGIFSHAVRTASLGIADLDEDGVLTYGELHYALVNLLGNTLGGSEPIIVPPGLVREATFIDWRGSPAARVCIPPSISGSHVLVTAHGANASLPLPPQQPGVIWLQAGQRYQLIGKHHDVDFLAHNGPLDITSEPANTRRGVAYRPMFSRPIEVTDAWLLPIIPTFKPDWHLGVGASAAIGDLADDLGTQWTLAALFHGRFGYGRHRLDIEAGWSRLGVRTPAVTLYGGDRHAVEAHVMVGRIGYDHLIIADDWEFALAALIGGVRRFDGTGETSPEAALRATALIPLAFAPTFSGRIDARAVLMPVGDALAALVQLGVGVDFEIPLD